MVFLLCKVRGYLLSAIGKICAQAGIGLTPDALELLHSAKTSRNVDLQQRALEVEALLRYTLAATRPLLYLYQARR